MNRLSSTRAFRKTLETFGRTIAPVERLWLEHLAIVCRAAASVGSQPCIVGVNLGIGVRLPLKVVVIVFVLAIRAAVEDVECGARRRSRRAAQ